MATRLMGGPALEGVLADPRDAAATIRFAERSARFVRLRQLGVHADVPWIVAELKIYGLPGS